MRSSLPRAAPHRLLVRPQVAAFAGAAEARKAMTANPSLLFRARVATLALVERDAI